MKNFIKSFKRLTQKLKDFFPSTLPQGMTEFDAYASSFIATYALPASDNDIRYVLAAMILNGVEGKEKVPVARVPKRYFVNAVKVAIAKQIAGAVFQNIQAQQKAKALAEMEAAKASAKPAEVTALRAVTSDGPQ